MQIKCNLHKLGVFCTMNVRCKFMYDCTVYTVGVSVCISVCVYIPSFYPAVGYLYIRLITCKLEATSQVQCALDIQIHVCTYILYAILPCNSVQPAFLQQISIVQTVGI